MKYLKSFKIFENSTLTFESILSKYDISDMSDYNSKFIITKFLEYYMFLNKDSNPLGLESLNKYSDKIFTKENIDKINSYKNSDWIKAIDIKLDNLISNYSNLVDSILREEKLYNFKSTGMVTTNIKVFRVVLERLNKLLPKEINFNFKFKGLVEITDKNFLKLLTFYRKELFSKEKLEEYIKIMTSTSNYSKRSEDLFLEYLKEKGIECRKATMEEDLKGIDLIDSSGLTYQVKAPVNFKVYPSGYYISKNSQLDIIKLKEVDRLALYLNSKFVVLDINDVELVEKSDGGLFIKIAF